MLENIRQVLVVDDSPINIEFLSMFFEEFDIDITRALSAEEARKEIATRRFDLTLLDYHMPVEDGVSFLKALNATDNLDRLGRIVIVTADPEFEAARLGVAKYIMGTLRKPLDMADLKALLEDWDEP